MLPGYMRRAFIAGTGSYLPARVVTNEEICLRCDTTDEWIRTKLGIETRRVAADDEQTSDLALQKQSASAVVRRS